MLEIESLTFRNFLSYGDYDTTIRLSKLGECFISGEIEDDNDQSIIASNGAGKSTVVNALMWALFGRTMHSHSPGNNVINYFTGKDCICEVIFKSGDLIRRIRRTNGQTELIYVKNGDEQKLTSDTLATSKIQQKQLSKDFNLDWDLLTGSTCFTQYNKPWLEMADSVRKSAMERCFRTDRFSFYADSAKKKASIIEEATTTANAKIVGLNSNIEMLKNELVRLQKAVEDFENGRGRRKEEIAKEFNTKKEEKAAIILPDLEKLQSRWDVVKTIELKLNQHKSKIIEINRKIDKNNVSINYLNKRIKQWSEKAGKMCIECEQTIDIAHTDEKVKPLLTEISLHSSEIEKLILEKSTLEATIKSVSEAIEQRKPKQSIESAKLIHRSYNNLEAEIANLERRYNQIDKESNPHLNTIEEVKSKITRFEAESAKLSASIERNNLLFTHYNYLYKAYNDRGKVKSLVTDSHIPFINNRLQHYFDLFGLDLKLGLTNSLGISAEKWGYEYQSGGERKRTDVAFMLAMFDLHEELYGRQCNVLVLDEVDGRMDDVGINALIDIIRNDFAHRVETVIVISHKNMMKNVFSNELVVRRRDRFSYIDGCSEVRNL